VRPCLPARADERRVTLLVGLVDLGGRRRQYGAHTPHVGYHTCRGLGFRVQGLGLRDGAHAPRVGCTRARVAPGRPHRHLVPGLYSVLRVQLRTTM
jgi:hypothetical protein